VHSAPNQPANDASVNSQLVSDLNNKLVASSKMNQTQKVELEEKARKLEKLEKERLDLLQQLED